MLTQKQCSKLILQEIYKMEIQQCFSLLKKQKKLFRIFQKERLKYSERRATQRVTQITFALI